MWSRDDERVGVSLLTLSGRVVATVRDAIIYEPISPPGIVVLQIEDELYLTLDASAHELRRVSAGRAYRLVRRGLGYLPSNAFSWWTPAPHGPQSLGQYWRQVSECQEPIAMLAPRSSSRATPVTGDSLGAAQSTYALGWTGTDQAVVQITPGCGSGSGPYRDGVYAFDHDGDARRIRVPPGSYVYRMWSPHP
jgi:hypothetical protein